MKTFLQAAFYVGDEWIHKNIVIKNSCFLYISIMSHQVTQPIKMFKKNIVYHKIQFCDHLLVSFQTSMTFFC